MSKLNIVVLGAHGMLGRAVTAEAKARGHTVRSLLRQQCDVTDPRSINDAFSWRAADPDWIINCAGALPGRGASSRQMVAVNALGPHHVAHVTSFMPGTRVLHVSTDCVFSGLEVKGRYWTDQRPDPVDAYGRSKLAGEVDAEHVTNVRTSFVGPDHGLWRWLTDNAAAGLAVDGWTGAWWTGSTVQAVAAGLVSIAESRPVGRLLHLATARPVNKHEVLCQLRDHLGLDIEIRPERETQIDRSLMWTHLLPSLSDALTDLKATVTS